MRAEQTRDVDGFERRQEELACGASLLTVDHIASLLSCSTRHVYRLADAGKMPRPIKLGALVRWSKASIEDWIGHGCPCTDSRPGGRR